jgi:dTDP-4-dehydrorhamnose reductase
MKTLMLAGLILIAAANNAHAMFCGNDVISEGDYIQDVRAKCGSPTWTNDVVDAYINKDRDGMNYYIHRGTDGKVSDIEFSRG